MALYQHGSTSRAPPPRPGKTEFEILKASHKFLRGEDDEKSLSWDEQLAAKYYASLYREFALCDLKHYKSGNFALRWRTEDEVLSGAGETTCGNTRCVHHHIPDHLQDANTNTTNAMPPLTTLELPFAYVEQGESKSALVKVVLCPKCFDKLMWKRRKEKEKEREGRLVELGHQGASKDGTVRVGDAEQVKAEEVDVGIGDVDGYGNASGNGRERRGKHRGDEGSEKRRRRRDSRSRSPRRKHQSTASPRRRSPGP